MDDREIKAPRLRLRPLGPEYLESTHAYAADGNNTRLMMLLPFESRAETLAYLEGCRRAWESDLPDMLEFAVLLGGVHIGHVGLELNAERDTAELEWVLRPDCHGRGYATEAARTLMDFAVRRFGVRRLIAHCDAENAASRAVMRKLGMMLVDDTGTRRNRGSDEIRRELLYEVTVGKAGGTEAGEAP